MPSPWPEPIAIVSAACRLPSADSPDAFWDVLSAGQPIVSSAPNRRWNTNIPAGSGPRAAFLSDSQLEDFDAAFFGLSDAEVADMDPHQRLMLSVGAEAVKGAGDRYWDANMRCVKDENSTMGVFVGVGVGAADAATVALQNPPTVHTNFGYLPFSIANRLSHALNLRGPSLTIDTACSASLTAVHYACQALHSGDCDWALAAGVNLITNPSSFAHIGALRILSPKYHSPIFTPDVDGYTRGEGCIAIVLKKLSDAEKDGDRILGVIRGSAGGHNGRTGRMMATPSMEGQSRVIREALQRAGLEPNDINYLEAHATGTQAGDKRELQTIVNVFGSRTSPMWVGGIKSLYGHSEGASGITSLLKALMIARYGAAPPVVHFTSARTDVELPSELQICPGQGLTPLKDAEGREIIRCGVDSFGAGGTNAHVILETYPGSTGPIGAIDMGYNLKPHSMIQQRGQYYRTQQVEEWEKAGINGQT